MVFYEAPWAKDSHGSEEVLDDGIGHIEDTGCVVGDGRCQEVEDEI